MYPVYLVNNQKVRKKYQYYAKGFYRDEECEYLYFDSAVYTKDKEKALKIPDKK